jgi:CMP/dCMP kinase
LKTRMIIAVDGPAGAGKSTVCKLLAQRLGYTYLDTGAMYRALAWAALAENLNLHCENEIDRRLDRLPLRFVIENGALSIFYKENRLTLELRQPEMSERASRISQLKCIREYLTRWQRQLGERGGIVAEGRDMTSVVFPDAQIRFYLTADLKTRAERRWLEYRSQGIIADLAGLEAEIRLRDEADEQRALAPLRATPGVSIVDASRMSVAEVVDYLVHMIREKTPSPESNNQQPRPKS